jgi:hypothetical protein
VFLDPWAVAELEGRESSYMSIGFSGGFSGTTCGVLLCLILRCAPGLVAKALGVEVGGFISVGMLGCA